MNEEKIKQLQKMIDISRNKMHKSIADGTSEWFLHSADMDKYVNELDKLSKGEDALSVGKLLRNQPKVNALKKLSKTIPVAGTLLGIGSALYSGDLNAALPMGMEIDSLGSPKGTFEGDLERGDISPDMLNKIISEQQNPENDNDEKKLSLEKLQQLLNK